MRRDVAFLVFAVSVCVVLEAGCCGMSGRLVEDGAVVGCFRGPG